MTATTTVRIRTADAAWCARRALHVAHGPNGYIVATLKYDSVDVEHLTFAGRPMIRFDLGADSPSDHNRTAMYPASYADPIEN